MPVKKKSPRSKYKSTSKSKGPVRRLCGSMEAHMRLLESDPDMRKRRARIHAEASRMLQAGTSARRAKKAPVSIPVVVHVVYRTAAENIPDAQISSQIDALNRDYAATNTDKINTPAVWAGLPQDTQIRFALATKDPKGKVTTGITRTRTKAFAFTTHDKVKHVATGGADAWPSTKYLNLWVCTLSDIWGDTSDCSGTDHVADTPNAQLPNYHVPHFPHISCGNGPNGDMFMNYMDYVDDKAMVMFTHGEVARMQATLAGPRNSIGA